MMGTLMPLSLLPSQQRASWQPSSFRQEKIPHRRPLHAQVRSSCTVSATSTLTSSTHTSVQVQNSCSIRVSSSTIATSPLSPLVRMQLAFSTQLGAARRRLAYRFVRGPAPHTVALFRGQAGASHTLSPQRSRSRITKQRCRHASLGLV